MRVATAAFLIAACLAPLPPPAAAQSPPCGRFKSQPEINACERQIFEQADAELQGLYKQLRAGLDGKELQALDAAQHAWNRYRASECDFETLGEEGGSIRPMEEGICYRLKTLARSAELKQLLTCAKDATGCPF